jgi:hypothetical protein
MPAAEDAALNALSLLQRLQQAALKILSPGNGI